MDPATVGSVMHLQVWTVRPEDTLESAGRGLVEHRLHWAPVVDASGAVLAVLSAWDLLRFAVEGRAPTMPVWQACTYRPVAVAAETPLAQAAQLMRELKLHHLPVLSQDGWLAGVVSSLDLMA
ncbi:MAG TPA: CBS domain-containing protein [Ramlibacter sp.]